MSKHHPAQCTLLAAVAAPAVSISMADERSPGGEDHHGYVLVSASTLTGITRRTGSSCMPCPPAS
jgi:hypothetical protein